MAAEAGLVDVSVDVFREGEDVVMVEAQGRIPVGAGEAREDRRGPILPQRLVGRHLVAGDLGGVLEGARDEAPVAVPAPAHREPMDHLAPMVPQRVLVGPLPEGTPHATRVGGEGPEVQAGAPREGLDDHPRRPPSDAARSERPPLHVHCALLRRNLTQHVPDAALRRRRVQELVAVDGGRPDAGRRRGVAEANAVQDLQLDHVEEPLLPVHHRRTNGGALVRRDPLRVGLEDRRRSVVAAVVAEVKGDEPREPVELDPLLDVRRDVLHARHDHRDRPRLAPQRLP
mmetsp:Transcript_9125/g.29583  ORF Transcript_9125/g.29583 Transcript_9125/m.29583 type:complete len:286 (-) Transcript_9125:181-1038(-)